MVRKTYIKAEKEKPRKQHAYLFWVAFNRMVNIFKKKIRNQLCPTKRNAIKP